MTTNEMDYYLERAEAELTMAQRSTSPQAVKAHYTLAGYYLDLVYSERSGISAAGASNEAAVDA